MENEKEGFKRFNILLPEALNRLYQRVKDRKVKEMIEQYKKEYVKKYERI